MSDAFEPLDSDELAAYAAWKAAAQKMQDAHAALQAAQREHAEALMKLGNLAAPVKPPASPK